jgi:hypothetical protein
VLSAGHVYNLEVPDQCVGTLIGYRSAVAAGCIPVGTVASEMVSLGQSSRVPVSG